jgi:hypothetical protein
VCVCVCVCVCEMGSLGGLGWGLVAVSILIYLINGSVVQTKEGNNRYW